MNRAQVIKILIKGDICFPDYPDSVLVAFYEKMKGSNLKPTAVVTAFVWFTSGWDAAAKRLRI